jgi:hypothetical protein
MNESVAGRSERDELSPLRPRWEWSADEIKRIEYRVVGMIAEHLTTLPDKKMGLVREICGSPLRSNGGRKLGLRDSVAALLPGLHACESVTGLTGETA